LWVAVNSLQVFPENLSDAVLTIVRDIERLTKALGSQLLDEQLLPVTMENVAQEWSFIPQFVSQVFDGSAHTPKRDFLLACCR